MPEEFTSPLIQNAIKDRKSGWARRQIPRRADTKTQGYGGKMEVMRLLQGRRERLWERRAELMRGIARAQEGVKNEEELEREAGWLGRMVRGRDVGEMARWNIRRLREKMRGVDG